MVDVMRAMAALTVITDHVIAHLQWKEFPGKGSIGDWFYIGWTSVDMLFVISGFVMVLSAVKSYQKTESKPVFRRHFLRRRMVRIAPLHYLTCAVFMIFILPEILFVENMNIHLISHALFIHNWHPETIGSINGVNWSLGVIVQFYLLVAITAGWLSRTSPLKLVLSCILISWTWRAVSYALFHDVIVSGNNLTWMYTSQVFGMLDLFGWGGALGLLIARDRSGEIGATLKNRKWICAALDIGLAVPLLAIYWPYYTYWNYPAMVIFWRTFEGLIWALFLASACGMGNSRMALWSRPLRYLGSIGYGLYLWHLLVIMALKKTSLVHSPQTFLVWTMCLSILCASASWHFFEKPFIDKYGR